jgi:ankyrin repeat protein
VRTIRPDELATDAAYGPWSCRGRDIWDAFCAAADGDALWLRRLLERDPDLYRAEYWYTQPIHFAVREGQLETVRILLEAGAATGGTRIDGDLLQMARDRGHAAVLRLLEDERERRGRTWPAPAAEPEIHAAAQANDAARVQALLDADPALVRRADAAGATPLHRAIAAGARETTLLLLDRGAAVDALHGPGPGTESGYAPADFQPIDLALWSGPYFGVRGDYETARLLLARGAREDVTLASALGDLARVRALLDADPARIDEARPSGRRPLSTAVQFGRTEIARLLLERGADPNAPESSKAPRGMALYCAAHAGDAALVELLLDRGADPNATLDSSGSATFAARTPELRKRLVERGGRLDAYDLVFLDEDDEVVRRVRADPAAAHDGCGGVLAAACTQGKRELVARLIDAGARVPKLLTPCRGYLMSEPETLQLLLANGGMDPNLPNWQRATPLHDICGRDGRGRANRHRVPCAELLLDAGARLDARDEDHRSTPLAWAARSGLPDMVELLLARGAPARFPDDEPWATPLAWATRRGHAEIADRLRRAGATA